MKWAVVGSLGMLGKDLTDFLYERGEDVLGLHRGKLEFTDDFAELVPWFAGIEVIVNCVAYTKVDQAEIEREQAFFANALVPSLLAQIADSVGAKLIHISTDYVFDGKSSAPCQVDSPKNPLSVYGETKSIGEDLVLAFDNSQIVRTSWLYGAKGNCFPRAIASKLLAGGAINVVDDQIGTPTHTKDLAKFIHRLGRTSALGSIWHGVGSGSTSWFGFAQEIALTLDALAPRTSVDSSSATPYGDQLKATSAEQYATAARRPANSVLLPSSVDGFALPDWKQSWSRASKSVLADLL